VPHSRVANRQALSGRVPVVLEARRRRGLPPSTGLEMVVIRRSVARCSLPRRTTTESYADGCLGGFWAGKPAVSLRKDHLDDAPSSWQAERDTERFAVPCDIRQDDDQRDESDGAEAGHPWMKRTRPMVVPLGLISPGRSIRTEASPRCSSLSEDGWSRECLRQRLAKSSAHQSTRPHDGSRAPCCAAALPPGQHLPPRPWCGKGHRTIPSCLSIVFSQCPSTCTVCTNLSVISGSCAK
jgi:hypothetical protein